MSPATSWTEATTPFQGWDHSLSNTSTQKRALFGAWPMKGHEATMMPASWSEASVAPTGYVEGSVAATTWTEQSA